ncbi:hypothetical protein TRKP33_p0182 (plasmid) [Klebsiella pneumoniae]|nr:hypothetical protein TRKP33_p0182 [Klebsiella pneumoniae]
MRCIPRGMGRSVDRGVDRPAIEPRKMYIKLPGADVVLLTEGNIIGAILRVPHGPGGV